MSTLIVSSNDLLRPTDQLNVVLCEWLMLVSVDFVWKRWKRKWGWSIALSSNNVLAEISFVPCSVRYFSIHPFFLHPRPATPSPLSAIISQAVYWKPLTCPRAIAAVMGSKKCAILLADHEKSKHVKLGRGKTLVVLPAEEGPGWLVARWQMEISCNVNTVL